MPTTICPVRLDAVTLRGVGSYLHGARLQIRPLTILCGTNGSGKSTWFKALTMLQKSSQAEYLPFDYLDVDDWPIENVRHANFWLRMANGDAHARLHRDCSGASEENQYGPPCTIGLEMTATHDHELAGDPVEPPFDHRMTAQQALFWRGAIRKGARFRVRLAHPVEDDGLELDARKYFRQLIELEVDRLFTVRFTKPQDTRYNKPCEPRHDPERQLIVEPYLLECSAAFLPGGYPNDDRMVSIAHLKLTDHSDHCPRTVASIDPYIDHNLAKQIVSLAVSRVQSLLDLCLNAFFYIGAIRRPYTYAEVADADIDDSKSTVGRRYVGEQGEATWRLEYHYGFNLMRQPHRHRPASISQRFAPEQFRNTAKLRETLSRPDARVALILEHTRPDFRQSLLEALDSGSDDDLVEVAVQSLNDLLSRRQLYDSSLWEPGKDFAIDSLLDGSPEESSDEKMLWVNRLLIEDALNDENDEWFWIYPTVRPRNRYFLDAYVSFWSHKLTGIRIVLPLSSSGPEVALSDGFDVNNDCLNGLLQCEHPHPVVPLENKAWNYLDDLSHMARFRHGCFGPMQREGKQQPSQLSSGFHQLAPFVVQAGLMFPNEVLAIENPEVHLHPSLQLNTTEFLLTQARSGRRILVETHSDLVVRRVLRAILEEELSQQQAAVYFVDLQRGPDGFQCSNMQEMEINERGQIANWPTGFMDDDIRESRRLMNALYGSIEDEDEDW